MYKTKELTHAQALAFLMAFDEEIGADRELKKIGENSYYVLCKELETRLEILICKDIERNL